MRTAPENDEVGRSPMRRLIGSYQSIALVGLAVIAGGLLVFAVTIGLHASAEGPAGTTGPPSCVAPVLIQPPFDSAYSCFDLGAVPSLPTNYGGLTFKAGDPNTIIIGGAANSGPGALYAISVVRDQNQHVVGFSGETTYFADAAYNDGGVVYGPGDVLFLARWPTNELGETKPGSSATDLIVPLGQYNVCSSASALNFVPSGFPGAGQLKLVTYGTGCWYTVTIQQDGNGTYGVTGATPGGTQASPLSIPGGPEGFIYVPPGSPNLPDFDSMLVSEYASGSIAAYQLDGNGDPDPASRVSFISGLAGAEGAAIDPLTGDFLFSTFGGANHVVRVSGFAVPATATPTLNETPTPTRMATETETPTSTATETSSASATATVSPPATPSPSPTAAGTKTPPRTPTRTATLTATATFTATRPDTPTSTPLPPTPLPSATAAPTFTDTPLPPPIVVLQPTETTAPTGTPTAAVTATASVTPSASPSPTSTSTPSSSVAGTTNPPTPPAGGQSARTTAYGIPGPEPRTTGSVPAFDQLSKNPKVVGTNLLLAIIMLIVLLFTSTVFNGTLDEHRVEVQSWGLRLMAPFRSLGAASRRVPSTTLREAAWLGRVLGPILVLGLTCLIYSFNEPGFGFNGKTAALFVSLVAGVGLTTYVTEGGETLITRRRFRVDAGVRLFPVAIAFALGFVILSRLSNFEAPIMYGFVASATLLAATKLEQKQSALAVLVPSLALLTLSVGAWFLLIPLRHASSGNSDWWAHLPSDIAVLVFAGGIEGLVFTMIPVRFTDGAKIFRWYPLLWFPLFLIPAFLFSWVILNPQAKAFDALVEGRMIVALSLVAAYVAATLAFWCYFYFRRDDEKPDQPRPLPPDGEHRSFRPAMEPIDGVASPGAGYTVFRPPTAVPPRLRTSGRPAETGPMSQAAT